MFHRASLKAYYDYLKTQNYDVEYLTFNEDWISAVKGYKLFSYRVYDTKLEKNLKEKVTFEKSLAFLGGELKKI